MFLRFWYKKDLMIIDNAFNAYGHLFNVDIKGVNYKSTENIDKLQFEQLRRAVGFLMAQKTFNKAHTLPIFIDDVLNMLTEGDSGFYTLKFAMDYNLKNNVNKFDLVLDAINQFDILATVDKEVVENLITSATKKDVANMIKLCNNLIDKATNQDVSDTNKVDVTKESCNDVVSMLKLRLYYDLYDLRYTSNAHGFVYDLRKTLDEYSKKYDSKMLKNTCFNDLDALISTIHEISMICWSADWSTLSNAKHIDTVNKCLDTLILFKMTIQ